MNTTLKSLIMGLSFLTVLGYAHAQIGAKKEHDERVEALLNQAKLKFVIDDNGNFKLINEFSNGRSHIVFINSETQKYVHLEIREVWAVGFISDGQITPGVMRKMLKQNNELKLGSWKIRTVGDKEIAIFYVHIAADTDRSALAAALRLVSEAADELEDELTGKDLM